MLHKISMKDRSELSVKEAFQQFIKRCKVKNLSPETIEAYEIKVRSFICYVGEESSVKDITASTVDEFILFLRAKESVSDITVNTYIRHVKAFLYYCMDMGYLSRFKISQNKATKKVKETYSEEELSILLKKPDVKKCSFTEYKCWVFENYLIGTGNRISTALDVHIGDVDFMNGTITLRKTKNRRQQIIPLSNALSSVLSEYLEYRGGESEDYLFCNIYGSQGCKSTFQQMVRKYNRSRGVTKTSCHLFRHTFAKMWIMSGGDIFRLQKILGHSDLTVTKEYVQMFSQDLQVDFDQHNPLDHLSLKNEQIKMKGKKHGHQ